MDSLRIEVQPRTSEPDDFEVRIYVNDVEQTSAGAGLGMDPYDVLVPTNRFIAGPTPQTIPAARCTCGFYGCGETDLTIVRDGDVVHWDWSKERPVRRRMTFEADAYESEVVRAGRDVSWETPVRTAGRLVLARTDREALAAYDLHLDWVANNWRDPGLFEACLKLDQSHQVFLRFPWGDRGPDALADLVTRRLERDPPETWDASWHAMQPGGAPPHIAGPSWRQERLGP